jgi:hypothetical protein
MSGRTDVVKPKNNPQPLPEIAEAMKQNLAANQADPKFDEKREERLAKLAKEALARAGLLPAPEKNRAAGDEDSGD